MGSHSETSARRGRRFASGYSSTETGARHVVDGALNTVGVTLYSEHHAHPRKPDVASTATSRSSARHERGEQHCISLIHPAVKAQATPIRHAR